MFELKKKNKIRAAVEYVKPDLICGTESWLKGIKPGRDPEKNCIKSCEVFPDNYIFHRNDRDSLGGGVFTGIKSNLVSDEKVELVTECEIVWTKVKLKSMKDLYLASFYMPHRNMKDIIQLKESINKLADGNKYKQMIIAGDFNCPDIDWDTLVVKPGAQDREVQQALLETSIDLGLTQVQREPTRYNNLLDLVFTNNPSLCKSSTSIPGISDHAMVVTDFDIIPHYIKQSKRKKYMFNKADWDSIYKEMEQLSTTMESQIATPVEELWSTFTTTVFTIIDKYTPSKVCTSRKSLP
ncbi:unnamed protein product [Mytilus edulis]|uniref:Endonuclease/exonuclease/phosphatase domain-containing protein n=1 Tax=Mytilus edulis TaxID=6550 RepID=A0A8S3PP13_MYTED|nr:unnamed protein product [Mytilus edulis]